LPFYLFRFQDKLRIYYKNLANYTRKKVYIYNNVRILFYFFNFLFSNKKKPHHKTWGKCINLEFLEFNLNKFFQTKCIPFVYQVGYGSSGVVLYVCESVELCIE
jgi:hypothetical protein